MNNKNQFKLIIILSVVFSIIFGTGLGFYLNNIYNLSPNSNSSQQAESKKATKEKIILVFREQRIQNLKEFNNYQDILIKSLSGKSYTLAVQQIKSPTKDNSSQIGRIKKDTFLELKGIDNLVAIDETFKVVKAFKKGVANITPILQLSPFKNENCSSEIQFLTLKSSTLTAIDQASYRNFAILNTGLNLSSIKLVEMAKKGFRHKSINFINDAVEGTKLLTSKEVDVLAIRIYQSDATKQIISPLGKFADGLYSDFPDLKIIGTTEYRIPCKLMFMKNNLRNETFEEFIQNSYKFINSTEGSNLFDKILGLSNAELLTQDQWDTITKFYLNENHNAELDKYSDKIVRKPFNRSNSIRSKEEAN